MRRVRQDTRQIKAILTKELEREDSCLSDSFTDAHKDLKALQEKLREEDR